MNKKLGNFKKLTAVIMTAALTLGMGNLSNTYANGNKSQTKINNSYVEAFVKIDGVQANACDGYNYLGRIDDSMAEDVIDAFINQRNIPNIPIGYEFGKKYASCQKGNGSGNVTGDAIDLSKYSNTKYEIEWDDHLIREKDNKTDENYHYHLNGKLVEKKYTVDIDYDNDSDNNESLTGRSYREKWETYATNEKPQKTGYTFVGWKVIEDLDNKEVKLTAQYNPITYTATIVYCNKEEATKTVNFGTKYDDFIHDQTDANAAGNGYKFTGWKLTAGELDETGTIVGDITITAQYETIETNKIEVFVRVSKQDEAFKGNALSTYGYAYDYLGMASKETLGLGDQYDLTDFSNKTVAVDLRNTRPCFYTREEKNCQGKIDPEPTKAYMDDKYEIHWLNLVREGNGKTQPWHWHLDGELVQVIYTVTFNYVDENGNKIGESSTVEVKSEEEKTLDSLEKKIPSGYEFDKYNDEVNGDTPITSDVEVTVICKKTQTANEDNKKDDTDKDNNDDKKGDTDKDNNNDKKDDTNKDNNNDKKGDTNKDNNDSKNNDNNKKDDTNKDNSNNNNNITTDNDNVENEIVPFTAQDQIVDTFVEDEAEVVIEDEDTPQAANVDADDTNQDVIETVAEDATTDNTNDRNQNTRNRAQNAQPATNANQDPVVIANADTAVDTDDAAEVEEEETIVDEDTPLAANDTVNEEVASDEAAIDAMTIADEETPLAAAEDNCFIHWIILLLTIAAGLYNIVRMYVRNRENAEETAKEEV